MLHLQYMEKQTRQSLITSPAVGVRSIAVSVSVCPLAYLNKILQSETADFARCCYLANSTKHNVVFDFGPLAPFTLPVRGASAHARKRHASGRHILTSGERI